MSTIAQDELVDRARNALSILGLTNTGEWAATLRHFIEFPNRHHEGHSIEDICNRIEFTEVERERQAAVSQYLGTRGERQEFTARVTFTKTFPPKETDDYPHESHMTTLADDDGNVIVYWNQIKLPCKTIDDPYGTIGAVKGQRVKFRATVADHKEFRGIRQTIIQRVMKPALV